MFVVKLGQGFLFLNKWHLGRLNVVNILVQSVISLRVKGLLGDNQGSEAFQGKFVELAVDEGELSLRLLVNPAQHNGVSTLAEKQVLVVVLHNEGHALAVGVEGELFQNFVAIFFSCRLVFNHHFLSCAFN